MFLAGTQLLMECRVGETEKNVKLRPKGAWEPSQSFGSNAYRRLKIDI